MYYAEHAKQQVISCWRETCQLFLKTRKLTSLDERKLLAERHVTWFDKELLSQQECMPG